MILFSDLFALPQLRVRRPQNYLTNWTHLLLGFLQLQNYIGWFLFVLFSLIGNGDSFAVQLPRFESRYVNHFCCFSHWPLKIKKEQPASQNNVSSKPHLHSQSTETFLNSVNRCSFRAFIFTPPNPISTEPWEICEQCALHRSASTMTPVARFQVRYMICCTSTDDLKKTG